MISSPSGVVITGGTFLNAINQILVKKSSGQFIFVSIMVRFVESNRHRPAARLDIILGITMNAFTGEVDALYKQILSSVDDIQLIACSRSSRWCTLSHETA
jgi:hypothetical protein